MRGYDLDSVLTFLTNRYRSRSVFQEYISLNRTDLTIEETRIARAIDLLIMNKKDCRLADSEPNHSISEMMLESEYFEFSGLIYGVCWYCSGVPDVRGKSFLAIAEGNHLIGCDKCIYTPHYRRSYNEAVYFHLENIFNI
jgi:hypothetical protein